MAGTLFGLPLSQQLDEDGDPYSGALLYIYEAQTSTPTDSYADSGLTTLNAFPLEADASGRIPQFWLNDGSYRARLTTAGGVEIFDEDSILAIGPSVASTGGGGGGGSVDATSVFATGDMKWRAATGSLSGWVRANARTIGSASSGASERASSDTQTLYEFLWNNFSNTLCPVATGRGGSALADFTANKAIGTLDMRGYGIFGLDDMGNSAVGRLVTGTPTTAASATGAEKTTLITGNLPAHAHDAGTLTAAAHTHDAGTLAVSAHSHTVGTLAVDSHTHGAGSYAVSTSINNGTDVWSGGGDGANVAGGAGATPRNADQVTVSLNSGTVSGTSAGSTATISGSTASATPTLSGATASAAAATVSGTTTNTGSGTAATTISPGRLGTWYIKL